MIAITHATTGIQEAALHEAERYQKPSRRINGTRTVAVEPITELSRNHGSAKTTIATMMIYMINRTNQRRYALLPVHIALKKFALPAEATVEPKSAVLELP